MKLNTALEQISEIHKHISKTEVFRGYRPLTIFFIGIISIVFSFIQQFLIKNRSDLQVIMQWAYLACIIFFVILINIIINYIYRMTNLERHQIKKILMQFIPGVLSGALITIVIINKNRELIEYLPGIWSILFGLAIISINPYLPELIYLSGFFYVFCGGVLLYLIKFNLSLNPWSIGLTFGAGHIISGLILYIYLRQYK